MTAALASWLPGSEQLPGGPWSVRFARGPADRDAVEIYRAGSLLDVLVATPIAPRVLRGAQRATAGGQPFAFAWGRLPADGARIGVAFTRRWRSRSTTPGDVIEIGGWCWLCVLPGRFGQVTVSHGGRSERHRVWLAGTAG